MKKQVKVMLSEKDVEAIQRIAKEKGLSLAAVVRMALKEYLRRQEETYRKILR